MEINPTSPVFWSTLAGAASVALGAIDPTGHLGTAVQTALIGVGAVVIWITTHHTVKAAVAAKAAKQS